MTSVPKLPKDSPWCPVYDSESKSYYFWNMNTQETTWENPHAERDAGSSNTGTDDNNGDAKTGNNSNNISSSSILIEQPLGQEDYTVTGHFNARTGKFENQPLLNNPANHSVVARSARQMSHFFDYNQWAEERGRKYIDGTAQVEEIEKKKKPSKKQLDQWKKRNKEKQKIRRAWLYD